MTNEEQPRQQQYYRLPLWQRSPHPSALPTPSLRLLNRHRQRTTPTTLRRNVSILPIFTDIDSGQPITPIHRTTNEDTFFGDLSNVDDPLERSEQGNIPFPLLPTALGQNDDEEWEEETKEEDQEEKNIPITIIPLQWSEQ